MYREITYAYTLSAARALLARSPSCTFHFLRGVGTDPAGRSRMMWARIKGEAKRALEGVGLGAGGSLRGPVPATVTVGA
jgi:hypothetical protein